MRFELCIATRYLRAKRRQAVVGVITAISVIGVAAGVASLIIALAITNGMRRDMQEKLVGSTAHVMLMRVSADGIRDWRPLLARLSGLPHVTAAAPGLYGQVLISRGARSGGAALEQGDGLHPTHRDRAAMDGAPGLSSVGRADGLHPTHRERAAMDGARGPASTGPDVNQTGLELPPIVIGQDLAETLGAAVGDKVLVTSPQGELTPFGVVPKYQGYRVVGVFRSGFYQYDSSYAFTRLADAQRLFSEPDLISAISFKVDDMYRADAVGREIEQAAGKGYETTNWMEENRQLFRALKLEQIVTFIILALIVCVAALNILIALTMMVMEKTKDIAVLMSFGVRVDQVRRISLRQGLLISVIWTVLGLIVGYGLSWAVGYYRFIQLVASVYSIVYLPIATRVVDAVIVPDAFSIVALVAPLCPRSP